MSLTAAERIYQDIKNDIVRAYYTTSEFLVERTLAAKYGVSKTPVREALHRLCQEGYLVSYARKGYLVNRVVAGEYVQIQQMRFFIESGCIRHIAHNSPDADIEQFRAALADDAADETPGARNARFHLALVRMMRNDYLVDTEERLLGRLHGLLPEITFLERNRGRTESHTEIVEALSRRDIEAAVDALRRDLTLSEYDV